MNYTQLRNALKLDGGSLTVSANTLTPSIAALLAECNVGQPLIITNASAGPGDDVNETVVIRGQSNFLNVVNLPVEVRGTIDRDGNAQIFLKYSLPDDWHFSDSFPTLPKVVDWSKTTDDAVTIPLDELPLSNSYFVVVSQKQTEPEFQVELKPGINFVSSVGPADMLKIVESVFGHSLPFNVYGNIRLPKPADMTPALYPSQFPWDLESSAPGILLQAGLGLETAIGPMKFADLFLRIYSPTTDEWLQENDTYKPVMAFTGKLKVPSANLELGVVAPIEPGSTELLLLGNFKGVSVAKLEDLIDLAGTGDLTSRLPDQLKQAGNALGKLELTHAAISRSLDASEPGISWVSFTIGLPERKWQIWDDHFEIDSLVCRFEETDPFNRAPAAGSGGPSNRSKFQVSVTGSFKIEGVPLNVRASNRDGFTAYAELASKQTIPLTRLMQTYVPGVPAPGDLTIDTLRVSVEPHKSYSMVLAISDAWKIPFGTSDLSVDDVYLSIQHTDGNDDVKLYGDLNIAGAQVAIDASHHDGSWKLQGKTDDQQSISFTHLLDELLKPCGISVPSNLPAGVLDLSFKNLSIAYDSASKDFHFSGESMAGIPVNFGNTTRDAETKFDLRITTDAKTGKRQYDGYLTANITLGGATFDCKYDFGRTTMITASWHGSDGGSLKLLDLADAHGIEHALQVPGDLSLDLTRAAFEYDFEKSQFRLSADSAHGEAFFLASNAKQKWDFAFGILMDLSHIPGVPSIDLGLQNTMLILSTVADDNFTVPSLPAVTPPGQPAVGRRTFPAIGTKKMRLRPGVTVAALLDLSSNDLLKFLGRSILKKDELLIQVAIGDGLSNVSFLSYLDGSLTLDVGVEKLVLSDPYIRIDSMPAFGIYIAGTTLIPFNHVTLQASGALELSDVAMEAMLQVKAQDGGKQTSLPMPFGLRGVSLDELDIEVGVIFQPPGVDLGIEGKFNIKGQPPNINEFIIVLDPKTGIPNPIYLSAYVQSLTISDLIMAVSGEDVSDDIPAPIKSLKGEELSVYWSETAGTPLPDGRLAQQGFGFNGFISIGGFKAHAALTVSEIDGVSGEAELDPINLGGVFSLTGNGKGVKVKQVQIGDAWERISKPLEPREDGKPWVTHDHELIAPGGATIQFNSKHSPYLDVSAAVSLFDLLKAEVEIEIANDRFKWKQKESIGSLFKTEFDCEVSASGFKADAEFSLDISGEVGPIEILGVDMGSIDLDVSFDAGMKIHASKDGFSVEISGSFHFEGFHLTMPSFTTSDFQSFDELPDKILKQIQDNADHIFKEVFDDAGALLKAAAEEAEKLGKEAAEEAERIGGDAAQQAKQIGEDAKAAFESATHDLEDAKAAAAKVAEEADKILGDAAKEADAIVGAAGDEAKELGRQADKVAEDAAKEAQQIGEAAEKEAKQIADDAQKVFDDAEEEAKQIGKDAEQAAKAIGDAAEETGRAMVAVANMVAGFMGAEAERIGEEIAEKLEEAWDDFTSIF